MPEVTVGIPIASSGGDLERLIYALQSRIDQIETMNSRAFTMGVIRDAMMLPSVGIKISFP